MHINLFLILFIVIIGLLFLTKDTKCARLWYIVICSITLILIASLRNTVWMTEIYAIDSQRYKELFESIFEVSWKDLKQILYMRYVMWDGEYDAGYLVLNKLMSLVTHEFWMFSILANLIFFVPFGIILYRYTTNILQIMFAFVFYIALVQVFLFAGARQIFAIGFDMLALLLIIDKRRLWAIIFYLIGITLHLSSVLFIIPLLMVWYNIELQKIKLIHIICFFLLPIVFMFPNQLVMLMGNAINMEKYVGYGEGTIQGGVGTFIFMIEVLSLFCLIAIKKKNMLANKSIQYFYVMAPLLTLSAPLIISNGAMIRISLYFHLFLSILVPYAIEGFAGKKNRYFMYFLLIFLLSFMTLKGGGVWYYFFWQDIPI